MVRSLERKRLQRKLHFLRHLHLVFLVGLKVLVGLRVDLAGWLMGLMVCYLQVYLQVLVGLKVDLADWLMGWMVCYRQALELGLMACYLLAWGLLELVCRSWEFRLVLVCCCTSYLDLWC